MKYKATITFEVDDNVDTADVYKMIESDLSSGEFFVKNEEFWSDHCRNICVHEIESAPISTPDSSVVATPLISDAHKDVMNFVTTHFRLDCGFSISETDARILYHSLRKDKGYAYLDSATFVAELEHAMSDVFGVGRLEGKYRNISLRDDL